MNLESTAPERQASVARIWIWVLILSQPVLDAVSYWAAEMQISSALTLGARMLILALTVLIAFVLSARKRDYFITAGILIVFWCAHMFACKRVGYADPVSDLTNYVRVAQLPIYTLALRTLLRRAGDIPTLIEKALAADLWIIAEMGNWRFRLVCAAEFTERDLRRADAGYCTFRRAGKEAGNRRAALRGWLCAAVSPRHQTCVC